MFIFQPFLGGKNTVFSPTQLTQVTPVTQVAVSPRRLLEPFVQKRTSSRGFQIPLRFFASWGWLAGWFSWENPREKWMITVGN
jgi:hypothetical protein